MVQAFPWLCIELGAGLIFCVVPSIEIRSRHGPAQFGNVQTEAKWRRKRTSPPRAGCVFVTDEDARLPQQSQK